MKDAIILATIIAASVVLPVVLAIAMWRLDKRLENTVVRTLKAKHHALFAVH